MSVERLRVERLAAHLVELPFRFRFGHALASRASSVNLIVVVQLADGSVGYGEGVPREYVTGETPDGALARVTDEYGPALLARDAAGQEHRERPARPPRRAPRRPTGPGRRLVRRRDGPARRDRPARPAARQPTCSAAPSGQTVRYGGVAPFASGPALAAMLLFFRLYGFQRRQAEARAWTSPGRRHRPPGPPDPRPRRRAPRRRQLRLERRHGAGDGRAAPTVRRRVVRAAGRRPRPGRPRPA